MNTLSTVAEYGVGLTPDERDFLFIKGQAAHEAKAWGELRHISAEDVVRLVQIACRLHGEVHELRRKLELNAAPVEKAVTDVYQDGLIRVEVERSRTITHPDGRVEDIKP
jgi:hypothetical protein